MRGAFGPILTTGVALAAAGVVVANPIVAPRSDVQIPAVALSAGSGDASGMLDQAFLDAIAPSPPESTNPFSVLRQLITSLAADATYLGKNAIVDAFVAGVTAVSQPELTASSTPYFPSVTNTPELAASVLPGLDPDLLVPLSNLGANVPAPAAVVNDAVVPVVQTLVGSVVTDAGYVGGQLVAAAFVAGAVVVAEPGLIGDTLQALITGDLSGALQKVVTAVTAPLAPTIVILNALRAVVEKNVVDVTAVLTATVPALDAVLTTPVAPQPILAEPAPAPAAPTVQTPVGRGSAPAVVAGDATSEDPGQAPGTTVDLASTALSAAATRSQAAQAEGGAEPSQAAAPQDAAPAAPTTPGSLLRNAVESVGQEIGAALTTPHAGAEAHQDSSAKGVARARAGKPGS